MLRGYSFRPRGWTLALAAAACAAFVALGQWQSRRAEEKRAIGARLETQGLLELPAAGVDPKAYAWRRVAARGEFVPERTIFLANKVRHGQPGYEVVTPLRLAGSQWHVLVQRGWGDKASVLTPRGAVRIEGIALERLPRVMPAGDEAKGAVRQNVEIAEFAAETGLRLQPLVIEQHSALDDGLLREWPRPDLGIEKHQSYSLQWYSLAALSIALVVVLSLRRAGQG